MTDIFAAIKNLEAKLIILNNNKPLVMNMERLDEELSMQNFVNPALLPFPPVHTELIATPEQMQEYASLVLQAVFNIANASKNGYVATITNNKTISTSFNFLDPHAWVPKIVDEQTYQIGKALQEFLAEALSEEILSKVPETVWAVVKTIEVREPAKQQLTVLKELLDKRLRVYEMHANPEQVKASAAHLTIKNKRVALWKNEATVLTKKNDAAQQLFFSISEALNKKLSNDPQQLKEYQQDLESKLAAVEQMLRELKETKQNFVSFNQWWNDDNSQLELPETMMVSPLIHALAIQDNELAEEEWLRLFNKDNVAGELYPVPVGNDLVRYFNSAEQLLQENESSAMSLATFADKETGILHQQLNEVRLLQHYLQQLKSEPQVLAVLEQPAVIGGEFPALHLNVMLSQDSVTSQRLAADKEVYTLALKELGVYQQQLRQQKEILVLQYQQGNPLPLEINKFHLKDLFSEARQHEQDKLVPQIDELEQQLNAVNELIQQATLAVKGLEHGLIKLNRDEALTTSTDRIQKTFKMLQEAQRKLSAATFNEAQDYQKYVQNTSSITQDYDLRLTSLVESIRETQRAIEEGTIAITDFGDKHKNREKFLIAARKKLVQFGEDLDASPELYIPAAKIAKQELTHYLECTHLPELMEFFDQLYTNEQNANAWGGWNMTRLIAYWNHNTSLLVESDLSFDLSSTSEYIADKIELIDQELEALEEQPDSIWIPEENLWSLKKAYELAVAKKHEDQIRLSRQQSEHQQLALEKNELLEQLNAKYSESKQLLAHASLTNKRAELANVQAVFSLDILKLDYALTDIEEQELSINKRLNEFAQLSNEQLIAQANEYDTELKKIYDALHTKLPRGKSVAGQVLEMESTLLHLEKEWEQVFSLALDTVPPTEINPELYQELQVLKKQMHASLEEKGLQAVFTMLDTGIAAQQKAPLMLKELAEIQINSAKLLEKGALIANYSIEERLQLQEEIVQYQRQLAGRMQAMSEFSHPLVSDKFAATELMVQELGRTRDTLEHLEQLVKINEIYSKFVMRIEQCQPENVLIRRKLLRDLDAFANESLGTALIGICKNNDPLVQKEREPLLKMHSQIDFFKSLYNTPSPLFDDIEKEEDRQYILQQLNQVIETYQKFSERIKNLPARGASLIQTLCTEIDTYQRSDLVTTLAELGDSSDPEILEKINGVSLLGAEFAEFKRHYNEQDIKREILFDNNRAALGTKYFGEQSIFNNYLQERANTFWFRDFLSSIAALALGCIGYKTEAELRKNYLDELQVFNQAYQQDPCEDNTEKLLQKINDGLSHFSPRHKQDELGYDKSLHAKLSGFKQEINQVQKLLVVHIVAEPQLPLQRNSF